MHPQMLELMVEEVGKMLYYLPVEFDDRKYGLRPDDYDIPRKAMRAGECVEIDLLPGGGDCVIRNVGVTDAGRVRFMRDGVEDMDLRAKFDKPIMDWVDAHRGC